MKDQEHTRARSKVAIVPLVGVRLNRTSEKFRRSLLGDVEIVARASTYQ
ncbi:hypothetical protein LHJ74_02475 [Streptomyces sp. N2-109]|uniref:Uncharacterized protein n=1 Tax=Streptomyces gossypii TaxID=2883101 RepID=A0ABT2JLR2_9ACTN|nr:hypothetical protein [Streptomyces gossypii]MCT2588812.1 hypothetical protein [Streptomyces gossypii]